MAKWNVLHTEADVVELGKKFRLNPVIARIICNRGVVGEWEIEQYLNGSLENLYDPFLLKNMELCVQYVREHIEKGSKIRVIGDYDVDGICAAYILKGGIRKCGGDVSVAIPHRITDGYGLNKNLMKQASQDGIDLIITCDNGISAIEEIAYAKELGIEVLVTDHHEPLFEETEGGRREIVPECIGILNPKQEGDEYPNKDLCGSMVAYKLMEALFKTLGESLEYLREEYLEFGACATICDVMKLQGENRILVKHGLWQLRQTKNIGLQALMNANEINQEEIKCHHIGFRIGPCFNATGRLETAMLTLDLLECRNQEDAKRMAQELTALNEKRKEMTEEGVENAIIELERLGSYNDSVYVIYLKDCHESIAGIIAGRVKERYNRPTFILTKTTEGVKGSGRSIEGYHMQEEMVAIQYFFTRFGGHEMAAGLSMKEELVEEYRKTLNENCRLTKEQLEGTILIDMELPFTDITEELIDGMNRLEPFGVGNRKPVFARREVQFLDEVVLGAKKNLLKATVMDQTGTKLVLVCLGVAQIKAFHDYIQEQYRVNTAKGLTLNIIFEPDINEFRGQRSIQLKLNQYE
ncbi:MAG: single-stranded-DNA-specific exonuclease RecJ [Eubacteriales bacterium]